MVLEVGSGSGDGGGRRKATLAGDSSVGLNSSIFNPRLFRKTLLFILPNIMSGGVSKPFHVMSC